MAARRLGFAPVDEIVVFSRGPWAYLTRGFDERAAAPRVLNR
jgi:hypothetical protein